jgi:hypothetical protein
MTEETFWHFATVDGDGIPRLGYSDGREIRVGETLTVECEPVLCEQGLHASKCIWDALGYAQGDKLALCQVTLGGTVLHDNDKSVGQERTVLVMLDADATKQLLQEFARWCALQVIHLWDAPDVVRQYLETGDESLRDAAWAAAGAAAWAAAGAAARAAAGDAAGAVAWDAARAAARAAAGAAARAVARDAARAVAGAAAWNEFFGKCETKLVEMFEATVQVTA